MVYENIMDLIGKTPSVRLNNIIGEDGAEVYVKLEYFNPSGSVKDRAAMGMIQDLEKRGRLRRGSTIVEPTSGNTGIGIAMIGAAKGYKVVLTMPDTLSAERRRMLSAYGAQLVLTEGSKGMKGAIEKAVELKEQKGYIMLSQFENPFNPLIHKQSTAREILDDFPQLDAFIAGIGTGGTVSGVAEGLKEKMPNIEIIGVEPSASAVISGKSPAPHKIQGIGAGFIPKNYYGQLVDRIITVDEKDAYSTTVLLAEKEGIFVGVSSGAAVWAALEAAKTMEKGKKVLALAPDGGSKYLSVEGLF